MSSATVRGRPQYENNVSVNYLINDGIWRVLRMTMPLVTLGLSKVTNELR